MPTSAPTAKIPVLIVGGGPIGLALAADLGRRGIAATLVEKNKNELAPAKMLEVSVRTMEFCRQLGVAEKVRNWGFPLDYPLDNAFVTSMRGYEIGRIRGQPLGEVVDSEFSPERSRPCPQTWFDPILQECARSFPHITIRHRVKLTNFEQDSNGVTATLCDLSVDREEVVRADYLVGCDGFISTVRDGLGIQVRGEPHIDWSMNIYLRIPDFAQQHNKAKAIRYVFVGPEGTWSFITLVDGKDLWRLQIVGVDEKKLYDADVSALIRRGFGAEIPYTVEQKTVWVRKRTLADRFMDGRVFLAGDSAHAHPPNGGLGMNTGLQDAFDLGWKLEATLRGWGGPALLPSYDVERRPASARALDVSFTNYRRLTGGTKHSDIEAATPAGDLARREIGDHLVDENTKSWQPTGVHLGYIYHPSPIIVPDGTKKPADDPVGYVPSAFPGARAPHVWLSPGDSILDLFGKTFVLLVFGEVATTPMEQAAAAVNLPFKVHRLKSSEAAALYARRLVLVRPDGHVAWRADEIPLNVASVIDTVRGSGPPIAARRAS